MYSNLQWGSWFEIVTLNEAANFKFGWDMSNSDESWVIILKARIRRSFDIIRHYIFYSVWQGIKSELQLLISHYSWVLGKHIQLWNDL